MIHTRTKIIALFSIGLLALSLAVYVGFVFMLTNHKDTLYAERAAVLTLEMQKKSLEDLVAVVNSSADERETLSGYILEDEQVIELLSLIETSAAEQGTTLTTNAIAVAPIDDTFEALEITVSVKGPFTRVMHVLSILETLPQQSMVSNVLLTKTEKEGAVEWQGTIDVQVTKYKNI